MGEIEARKHPGEVSQLRQRKFDLVHSPTRCAGPPAGPGHSEAGQGPGRPTTYHCSRSHSRVIIEPRCHCFDGLSNALAYLLAVLPAQEFSGSQLALQPCWPHGRAGCHIDLVTIADSHFETPATE